MILGSEVVTTALLYDGQYLHVITSAFVFVIRHAHSNTLRRGITLQRHTMSQNVQYGDTCIYAMEIPCMDV